MSFFEDPKRRLEIDKGESSFLQDQERILYDDVTSFRATVLAKMQSVGANTQRSWMLFKTLEPSGPYLGLPDSIPTDTLVLKYPPENDSGDLIPPTIRIFNSEAIHTRRGVEFVVKDVTVDGGGKAQYFIDMIADNHLQEEDLERAENGVETTEGNVNLDGRPKLSVPIVHNGKIVFYYCNPLSITPCVSVQDNFSPLMPFGLYNNIYDRQYAVSTAIELFGHIAHLEPDDLGELQQL